MALLLFRRVPEKPVLENASKQLGPSRLTTHPTQQLAKRGGSSVAVGWMIKNILRKPYTYKAADVPSTQKLLPVNR